MSKKKFYGFGLVEVIIAIAIVSISLFALSNAANLAFLFVDESTREGRAAFLLEEGAEAVRTLRDVSWTQKIAPLTSGNTYYPVFNVSWNLATTDPGAIEGIFTRTAVFEDVYRRNSDDDIVDAGAADPKTLDPGTKKVTIYVLWKKSGNKTTTRSLSTYITNLFQN